MARQRGRDGRVIPTVDVTTEALEIERRRYHQRVRAERAKERSVERALEEAAPRFRDKGWRVTKERVFPAQRTQRAVLERSLPDKREGERKASRLSEIER